MQFYYGEKNLLRALDEAEFWKHQEAEHTSVIQMAAPGLEAEYVSTLKEFGTDFGDTYSQVVQDIQSVIRSNGELGRELTYEITECLQYCVSQSKRFVTFLDHMLQNSGVVKKNAAAQTVVHHIIRESRYFIGIEQIITT